MVNFDQTALRYVPAQGWAMDPRGDKKVFGSGEKILQEMKRSETNAKKKVAIAGFDDKREITGVLAAGAANGSFLPV